MNLPVTPFYAGDFIFKGYPSSSGSGNIAYFIDGLAIAENSPNKDAAWRFVRTVLTKDWQLDITGFSGFPTNQAAFDYRLKSETDFRGYSVPSEFFGLPAGNEIIIEPLTQEDIDKLFALIESIPPRPARVFDEALMNIVVEDASGYFSGAITAEQAAQNIQSRASVWLSERS